MTYPHYETRRVARRLENLAVRIAEAQEQGEYRLAQIDGWPAGKGDGRASGVSDPAMRAALLRAELHEFAEQIGDDLTAIDSFITSIDRMCSKIIGRRDDDPNQPTLPILCDGSRFEGAQYAWVPHSRDHNNGWHDPTCRDIADESELCPRCKIRERRWREDHDLKPRKNNQPEPGREVVTRNTAA